MGLIANPPDFVDSNSLAAADLNTWKNSLINEFNGNIDDTNLKANAAIARTKVADTALVSGNTISAGNQNISRPTTWTAGAERIDPADRSASVTVIPDGAVTIALVDAGKRIQRYSYANTSALMASIATITGGNVGQIYMFIIDNQDASQAPIFVHTDADGTDNIKTKTGSNRTFTPTLISTFVAVYGDLNGSGFNQWWEL